MEEKVEKNESIKTKATFLLMNLTNEPLVAFYSILPFILKKELHINAFQLSLFIMLRPVLSSFSFFWGISLNNKKNPNLLKNSLLAWILARIPFLLFPFINNFYYIFFAAGLYQLFYRAGLPAWTEILKRNIKDEKSRHNLFSIFSVYSFIESIILGIFIGNFLDKSSYNWKIIFFSAALLSLSSLLIKVKIKVPIEPPLQIKREKKYLSSIGDIFVLLKQRKDFATFQICFMIGGLALMFIAPALYIYSTDVLNLTHQNMTNGRLIFMGVGFSCTSFIWKKYLLRKPINNLMLWVLFGFSIYIFFLLLSKYNLSFFYLAFFFYGIAQAGSTLLWNLSGIIFSRNQNSILFTSTNLLFLGIRGLIAPFLGSLFCYWFGAAASIFFGFLILLYGIFIAFRLKIKETSKKFGYIDTI